MNIAILGATGLFGKALVKSLSEDTDYHLTLIARHAKSEYQDNDRISVIDADATDIDALKKSTERNRSGLLCNFRREPSCCCGKSGIGDAGNRNHKIIVYGSCWHLQ